MKQFAKFLFLAIVSAVLYAEEVKPPQLPKPPKSAPTTVSDQDMVSFMQIRLEFEMARNTVLQMEGGCVSLPNARKFMEQAEGKMQVETERILKSAGCEAKKCSLDEFVDPTDKRKKLIVKRQ